MHDQGYLPSTEGTYRRLKDFSANFAKAEYYTWQSVGLSADNFVIRTDLVMQTSNQTFPRGGCGFVIHDGNMIMLSQKGNAYRFDEWNGIGPANYIGESHNPWEVELTLIFQQDTAWLLINGKERLTAGGFPHITRDVAYAVISGSSDSYGTRCEFKNTDFWILQE